MICLCSNEMLLFFLKETDEKLGKAYPKISYSVILLFSCGWRIVTLSFRITYCFCQIFLFHKWLITPLDTSLKGSFSRSNFRTFGHYTNLKEAKNCGGTISILCTLGYTWGTRDDMGYMLCEYRVLDKISKLAPLFWHLYPCDLQTQDLIFHCNLFLNVCFQRAGFCAWVFV